MENYYEIQKFDKWWIKLIFFIPLAIVIYGLISGKTLEGNETHLLIAAVIIILVAVLFYFTKLESRLDVSGLTIRFFPFQRIYYYVKWEEVDKAAIRQYKPLMEYGGWGLRYSFKHGKAFNVSGNMGLQLELKSGKKILIGTQKPKEMSEYLLYLNKEKAIDCIQLMGENESS